MVQYLKAVYAAIVLAVTTVVEAVTAAATDGITSDEWKMLAATVVGSIIAVITVIKTRNKPAPPL